MNAGHKKAASQRDKEEAVKGHGSDPVPASIPAAATTAAVVAGAATQPASNKTLPEQTPEARIALTQARLEALGISFSTIRHAAANKLEDLLAVVGSLPGTACKNLFIKVRSKVQQG